MTSTFTCPCLNICVRGKQTSGSIAGETLVEVPKEDGLTAEHPFLTQASFSSSRPGEAVLRCLNCATEVASYAANADPHTLPEDGRLVLTAACLPGSALEEARLHDSHSHAFRILIEPPNAPAPHLEPSPPTAPPLSSNIGANLSPPRASDPASLSSSPRRSPIKPRHAQSDPTTSLNQRLAHAVRAQRSDIDRQVAELRRTSEAYTRRASKEADILAARAGVQRGGFTTTAISSKTPTSTPSPVVPLVGSSVTDRSELLTAPPTTSPSKAVSISANAATKQKTEDLLKNKFAPSPYPVPVVRPAPPATTPRSQSTESLEGRRERKVTFVDPPPAAAPASGAAEKVAEEQATDDEKEGRDIFELDEELPEPTDSDDSDTDGIDAPETPRVSSPDAAHKGVMSPKDVDAGKAAQARQLRDLLAVDLPSHRKTGRRRSSQVEEEESITSSSEADSTADTSLTVGQYASSIPVAIDAVPRLFGMAADAAVLPSHGNTRASHRQGQSVPAFATSLREATERALANAAQQQIRPTAPAPVASEPMTFSKSPPPENHFAGSFRGPSSLTSALMRGPPPAPTQAQHHLPATIEEASMTSTGSHEDDDDLFVPPHMLSRIRRGDEGLLSTSVRDLYD